MEVLIREIIATYRARYQKGKHFKLILDKHSYILLIQEFENYRQKREIPKGFRYSDVYVTYTDKHCYGTMYFKMECNG